MSDKLKLALAAAGLLMVGWVIGDFRGSQRAVHGSTAAIPAGSAAVGHSMRGGSAESEAAAFARTMGHAPAVPTGEPRTDKSSADAELRAALRQPNDLRRMHDVYECVSKIDRAQIASLLTNASQFSNQEREVLLPILAGRWAETNPREAADFALTLKGNQPRFEVMRAAIGVWTGIDPEAAKSWAAALPASAERSQAVSILVSALSQRDPQGAIAFLESLPRDARSDDAYFTVFTQWAGQNADAAAAQALALPRGQNRDQAIRATINRWAHDDPQAALACAKSLPDVAKRIHAMQSAWSIWISADPESATAHLLAMPSGDGRSRALASAVASAVYAHSDRDRQTALKLINELPSGGMRSNLMQILAGEWAKTDPGAAAEYVLEIPAGEARNNGISDIATTWARHDLAAALSWAIELPEGDVRRQALRSISFGWAHEDPRAALEHWVQNVAATQDSNGIVAGELSVQWAWSNPEEALQWARASGRGPEEQCHHWCDEGVGPKRSWASGQPTRETSRRCAGTGCRTVGGKLGASRCDSGSGLGGSIAGR